MDFYFENDQRLELGGVAQKLDGNDLPPKFVPLTKLAQLAQPG